MRNFLIAAVLMILVSVVTWYLDSAQRPPVAVIDSPVSPLPAQPAPDVAIKALDNTEHNLVDFKGRRVILNIWATWCTPCLAEMPQLLSIARDNPDDLTLILLSVDSDQNAIQPFFERHDMTLPANALVVWDKDKAISKDVFGTVRYPETILIDTDGLMARKVSGAVDWNGEEMRAVLTQLNTL